MAKLLCERCNDYCAVFRVYVTDIDGRVLEADRVCLACIALDLQGNIEVDFSIGKEALNEAKRRSAAGKEV